MQNKWFGQLIETATDGPALSNSASETSIIPAVGKWVLEAGYFNRPGDELMFQVAGRLSSMGQGSAGNFNFKLKLGSIVVWDSGAIPLNQSAKTTVPFIMNVNLTARAVGSGTSANLIGIGMLTSDGFVTPCQCVPISTPAVGTGFDSTSAQILDLTGTFSVANAGNAITVHQFKLISPN
jgi:hypothetical protein